MGAPLTEVVMAPSAFSEQVKTSRRRDIVVMMLNNVAMCVMQPTAHRQSAALHSSPRQSVQYVKNKRPKRVLDL